MTCDRQLRPHIPIKCNETLLRRLHGHPQLRTFNNVSIPLDLPEDTNGDSKSENYMNSISELETNSESDMNSNHELNINC